MPKILSYTPAWLSNPSLGHKIFTAAQHPSDAPVSPMKFSNGTAKKVDKPGPKRTIAHRGSEVFVAVGKEIRWADLVIVKERYEDQQNQKFRQSDRFKTFSDAGTTEDGSQGYRVRSVDPLC